MAAEEAQYKPKDSIKGCIQAAMVTGGAGAILSGVQNTLTKQNIGAWGFVTRTGSTIGYFTAIGATYEFTKMASANLREKDDWYNSTIGGFMGGMMLGLKHRAIAPVLGYGAGVAIVMGAFEFTGGSLSGNKDKTLDEFERKEQLRKNRRRPIEETLSEIGEGRGIYGPGYEERRAVRMKEKYGIDLPVKS